MFIILFAITPFGIDIRNTSTEIWSLFYWIKFTATDMSIDAPFPSGNNAIPSPFLWLNLLQFYFVISFLLHYKGMSSKRNTMIAVGIGLFTGVLTFIMNGIGTLLGGPFMIFIPVPIPTLVGLSILILRPRPEKELWLEESEVS